MVASSSPSRLISTTPLSPSTVSTPRAAAHSGAACSAPPYPVASSYWANPTLGSALLVALPALVVLARYLPCVHSFCIALLSVRPATSGSHMMACLRPKRCLSAADVHTRSVPYAFVGIPSRREPSAYDVPPEARCVRCLSCSLLLASMTRHAARKAGPLHIDRSGEEDQC
ncbi:hypothetical protein DFH06DRAFT_1326735 [Mycena polygramma]|nr:hypothetical protein DFH06DRAFT_1326735 [Mycena polygramma]